MSRLDYASRVTAVSADDKRQAQKEIRVNELLSFEGYKSYQQTYGTAGSVCIENHLNGASESLALTESCFLPLDGSVTLITSTCISA